MDVAFFALVCSAPYGVSASITRTRQVLIEHHETRLNDAENKRLLSQRTTRSLESRVKVKRSSAGGAKQVKLMLVREHSIMLYTTTADCGAS